MKNFNKTGVKPCDILIPQNPGIYDKWAVIACDQFTSQPEYWENVSKITSGFPSTFDIIFPEVYLDCGDMKNRIDSINKKMDEYIKSGIFQNIEKSFILVDRTLPGGKHRKGLMTAFDLECYDYGKNAGSLIRATEGTVIDRLPPRVAIRENAALEVPHIMILIDDPGKTVIEPLFNKSLQLLYDFELMLGSGRLTGRRVCEEEDIIQILSALEYLRESAGSDTHPFLFAVGDGNHSLASAKVHWENIKKTLPAGQIAGHPARFALAELVNLHDDSLEFESINRICFNTDPERFLKEFEEYFSKKTVQNSKHQVFKYSYGKVRGEIEIQNCSHFLEIGTLQEFLDYKSSVSNIKIDYIHGEDAVYELSSRPDAIGFVVPAMNKNDLFKSIEFSGALPRKTFSMGEAAQKRFYFECRAII